VSRPPARPPGSVDAATLLLLQAVRDALAASTSASAQLQAASTALDDVLVYRGRVGEAADWLRGRLAEVGPDQQPPESGFGSI
jgi:hypothetical protein